MGGYRDSDVVMDVYDTGDGRSVAAARGYPVRADPLPR